MINCKYWANGKYFCQNCVTVGLVWTMFLSQTFVEATLVTQVGLLLWLCRTVTFSYPGAVLF